MRNYIGIDLGTTNSAICAYDGENLQLFKSTDQHDVTPSAIFIDRRGNKYIGARAYNQAARSPDNAATLFKRFMGTSTPVKLPAVNVMLTPEECSSEILKMLFGYLPEETRNSDETGTVITVPAAFNQMQKDATMSAAEMASIGRVALMQEPVAAVMSVMRQRNSDGMFLVYDLGGGTLDIAIAESTKSRVNLLSHGGIAMCGGRDFDRVLWDNIVKPWLHDNFALPDDFSAAKKYAQLRSLAIWAAEKAKIDLSSREDAVVSLSDNELSARDEDGQEIYVDIPISRSAFDPLIKSKVDESIHAAREAMEKAGVSPHDIDRVVFVGGPTNYKPLRDRVAFELGIATSTDVNPMTAVAEGAAVFAESIDWGSPSRQRKSSRGSISAGGGLKLSFNYIARTPDVKAKIAVNMQGEALPGAEFQVDSLDTGWTSGRVALKNGATLDLMLSKPGQNTFKIFVFDPFGGPIPIDNDRLLITRTAASIDAIPSSSCIAIEVQDAVSGRRELDFLVREGEPLPKKGKKTYKAGEALRAGTDGALNFKIWEGDIEDRVTDNRFVGAFKIRGVDFEEGVIPAGADLECEYEVVDSGNIVIEVSVPCISSTFQSGRNFYSRQDGQIDYSTSSQLVAEEVESLRSRVEAVAKKVDSPRIDEALEKLDCAASASAGEGNPEDCKKAMDGVLDVKKLLAQARREHIREIRQLDLEQWVEFFERFVKEHARPAEITSYGNLVRTAQRAIDNKSRDFESRLEELKGKNFDILWRHDWFVVQRFHWSAEAAFRFPDRQRHAELVSVGNQALKADDMAKLRQVVAMLDSMRVGTGGDDDMMVTANIARS